MFSKTNYKIMDVYIDLYYCDGIVLNAISQLNNRIFEGYLSLNFNIR